jgi:N-acetylglutamate synthase-like GNAT family acetyltransferase
MQNYMMAAMTMPNVQVRRASIEDLPTLVALWTEENLPGSELEERFKEFQVVATPDGQVLAAIGLVISGVDGLLHSEVFAHPEQADSLRELLWQRAQILGQNHGIVRFWTSLATPFWHLNGFRSPDSAMLSRLPSTFSLHNGPWLFLQVKEEVPASFSVEREFALFREAQKEETERLFRQARILKVIAAVLGIAVFLLVILWAFFFFKTQGHLPRH